MSFIGEISGGFPKPTGPDLRSEKEIILPDETLLNYLSKKELAEFKNSKAGIFSITIFAEK